MTHVQTDSSCYEQLEPETHPVCFDVRGAYTMRLEIPQCVISRDTAEY